MLLNLCILTNQVNLNGAQFTDDYINGVVENKDTYIGIPLVVNKFKLESGLYASLTHELDKQTGLLKTQMIGSFSDFWQEEDDDKALKLMGSVKVLKRYPKVCEAIIELYESDDLEMSCEVLVNGYESNENGIRKIAYKSGDNVNFLIGSALVSSPAEVKSKATLLIAEAVIKDLEGGETVPENNEPITEVFNKGNDIKYHGEIEISALKTSDISGQIYNILNPIDPKNNYRKMNFWISDIYFDKSKEGFDGHAIVEDWDDYKVLWKIYFSITDDSVVLDDKSNWTKGTLGFIPDNVDINILIAEKEILVNESNNKINELNNEHKEEKSKMEEQMKELQEKFDSLEVKNTELSNLVVTLQEDVNRINGEKEQLVADVETLKPFKEKVETSEKEEKQSKMVDKYSKLLSEEVMKSEVVVSAIDALDEGKMNEVVVSEIAKERAIPKPETTVVAETVIVTASKDEDLLPTDKKGYWYGKKAE